MTAALAADVATRAIAERLKGEISARLGSAATLVETRSSLPVRIQIVIVVEREALRHQGRPTR